MTETAAPVHLRTAPLPHAGVRFRAEVEQRDGAVVLHLLGELDIATIPRAQAVLDDAGIGPDRSVELHLDQLESVDSSGLACFVEVHRRARSLVLLNPTARVDRALRVSGLETFFAIRRDKPPSTRDT